MEDVKATPVALEPQPTSVTPSGNYKSGSPKKMKTMMSDDVSQSDLTITTLMQDFGSSPQNNPSSELKFWSNNFDSFEMPL